jgi:acyl carrier protein
MGMDTIELVMAVEEQFGVQIPDEVAATLGTVGKLNAWVTAELHRLDRPRPPEVVSSELRDLIASQLGVPASEVVPEARFVQDLGAD